MDISANFTKNPILWVFLAFFVWSVYQNYDMSKDIEHLCDLTGSHDVSAPNPKTAKQAIDNVCLKHQEAGDDSN